VVVILVISSVEKVFLSADNWEKYLFFLSDLPASCV
jgi:hypothetical protein